MNLLEYLRVIYRRGWIVVLAAVITAGAAYGFSQTQTEIYRANQRVLHFPGRNDFGLTETMRVLLQSFVEYLYTDEIAAQVINELSLDMLPGDLRSNTTITSDSTTLIIQISVDLEDGPLAASIATTWGQKLVEWRGQENSDLRREDRINAQLLDTATYGLHRPNTRVNVLAGAILGLILGGLIVFVLEFLESNIIRRADDVERIMGASVLAAIPQSDRGR